jgi:hypothetical protein
MRFFEFRAALRIRPRIFGGSLTGVHSPTGVIPKRSEEPVFPLRRKQAPWCKEVQACHCEC